MGRTIAALLLLLMSALGVPAMAADVVYVMRHLQKATGDDPVLTPEGVANANGLAAQLANSRIRAVFATATRRAAQTGEPLARAQGLTVTTYDPRNVPALVAAVNAISGNVLVVGHSNTVPDLVAAFGGTKPAPLTEADYGTIYVVKAGSTDVVTMPVSPAPSGPERGR
ncbi:histidine phosphatase family protein [Sphingomonas lutea]|uniref:Histidine phosphatase family protein n=1 Tax=Sphingomonas lutea TaxID=1045317 RepID=A0A7G9SH60_9SPHN|nr:phosphoglycerate mutase family protein [Sphingomonas lutea]QNN67185.1 histidine phosphatase family protein [Sphingomonas lutea]